MKPRNSWIVRKRSFITSLAKAMTWQILIAAAKVIQKRLINLPRSNIFTFDHHYLFDFFFFWSFISNFFPELKNLGLKSWTLESTPSATHFFKRSKLAILPEHKCPWILCLALRPHQKLPKLDFQSEFFYVKKLFLIFFSIKNFGAHFC